jgi:hypothetical protein
VRVANDDLKLVCSYEGIESFEEILTEHDREARGAQCRLCNGCRLSSQVRPPKVANALGLNVMTMGQGDTAGCGGALEDVLIVAA